MESANAARQYILSVCVSVCNNAIHALCQNVVISCSYAWHKNSGFSIDILIRLENSTISWRHTHSLGQRRSRRIISRRMRTLAPSRETNQNDRKLIWSHYCQRLQFALVVYSALVLISPVLLACTEVDDRLLAIRQQPRSTQPGHGK